MTVKKILINEDNEGRRIDNFLISIFSTVPKSKIYNIIRKGEVRVNSSRKKPNYKLKLNDLIRIPPNLKIIDTKIKIIKSTKLMKKLQKSKTINNLNKTNYLKNSIE